MFRQTPVIPIFGRYKQKDQGFKASLGYIVSLRLALSVLKKKTKQNIPTTIKIKVLLRYLNCTTYPSFLMVLFSNQKNFALAIFFFFFTNRVLFV